MHAGAVHTWHEAAVCCGAKSSRVLEMLRTICARPQDSRPRRSMRKRSMRGGHSRGPSALPRSCMLPTATTPTAYRVCVGGMACQRHVSLRVPCHAAESGATSPTTASCAGGARLRHVYPAVTSTTSLPSSTRAAHIPQNTHHAQCRGPPLPQTIALLARPDQTRNPQYPPLHLRQGAFGRRQTGLQEGGQTSVAVGV